MVHLYEDKLLPCPLCGGQAECDDGYSPVEGIMSVSYTHLTLPTIYSV